MGLIDEVVPRDELLGRARELAVQLARGPLAAHALAKAAIDDGLQVTLAEGLALEQAAFVEVFRTEDARLGVASFLEHGPGRAEFTGR
jgi:enoyl-CoA hydratase